MARIAESISSSAVPFGAFGPREKRHICENLAHIWGVNAEAAADAIEKTLTEEEEKTLKDLNEFDFEDL